MNEIIVTSFSKEGEHQYGQRMVSSVIQHWKVPTVVYVEGRTGLSGIEIRQTSQVPKWDETRRRLPMRTTTPGRYKPLGYLWQARRFAVKVFVWCDAAERLGQGIVTWLDGDTVVRDDVPDGFAASMLCGSDVAYLGRGTMHPETGCVVFRVPEAMELLRWCRKAYTDGRFRRIESGWTDCHVLREGLRRHAVKARDLTSHLSEHWTSRIDAMGLSPLGPYVSHLKGKQAKREAVC